MQRIGTQHGKKTDPIRRESLPGSSSRASRFVLSCTASADYICPMMKPQLVPLFTEASGLTAGDAYLKLTAPTVEREMLLSERPLTLVENTLATYFLI